MLQALIEAFSQNHTTLCWILTSAYKYYIISIQYPSHERLLKKSDPDFLTIQ